MKTKIIRKIRAFARHGYDIEFRCSCGHATVLPERDVIMIFSRRNWPIGLNSARRKFRCTACGAMPTGIGPKMR